MKKTSKKNNWNINILAFYNSNKKKKNKYFRYFKRKKEEKLRIKHDYINIKCELINEIK